MNFNVLVGQEVVEQYMYNSALHPSGVRKPSTVCLT